MSKNPNENLRESANLPTQCPTCTRDPYSPYRVYDPHGKVVVGCVDACHAGKLVTPSESAFWHNRVEAKKIRRALKRMQEGK